MAINYRIKSIEMNRINRIFIFTCTLMLLVSCGEKNPTLKNLKEKKDSLLVVRDEIKEQLTEVQLEINDLDTAFVKRITIVTVLEADTQSFAHYFNIHGVVKSDKTALLLPESAGVINSVLVKAGDKVRKGQKLARLDAAIVRSRIAEVRTSLELATTIFEKQERLWNKKIGSEVEYLQSKNRKESLESALKTLQSQLSMSTVKAPYAGTIDEIFLHAGEMASPMRPMFRIVNNGIVYLESEVSENHISDVHVHSPVEVVFPSLGDTIEAQIDEVSGYINPENRSFKVKVHLDRSDIKLFPNLLASMKIRDYEKKNAVVIKSSLIQQSPDGRDYIYLLKEAIEGFSVEKRFIDIGKEYMGRTEVLSGLKKGEKIIDKGARTVRNGQEVEVVSN